MALHLLSKCGCTTNYLKTKLIHTLTIRHLHSKATNILKVRKSNVLLTRTFWQFFKKPSLAAVKRSDNIPEHFEMIYRNSMSRYIMYGQVISVGSIAIIFLWVLFNAMMENSIQSQKWGNPVQPKPKEDDLMIFLASFIFFCTVLQAMVYKMPLRIYNYSKSGEYVFVFCGVAPTLKRQVTCKLSEIYKIDTYSILPWKDCRIEIDRKQRAIVLEHFFRKPADYNIMVGYQKPEVN